VNLGNAWVIEKSKQKNISQFFQLRGITLFFVIDQ